MLDVKGSMNIPPSAIREIAPLGVLRAAISLSNPVLASSRTATERPAGVTIDLAREFARHLGVAAELVCLERAADATAALVNGQADIAFLAIDPGRADKLAFTQAYLHIEGAYAVTQDSLLRSHSDVDGQGAEVFVGEGSAYDLFLSRHLMHARLTRVQRSDQVTEEAARHPGAIAAGVRQQLEADIVRLGAAGHRMRLLDGHFMLIQQAAAMARDRPASALEGLDAFIRHAVHSGFVANALGRHQIEGARVAQ